jgi:hypothetical protein
MSSPFDLMEDREIIRRNQLRFETIEQIRARDPQNGPPPYCSSKLAELVTAPAHKHGVLISAGRRLCAHRRSVGRPAGRNRNPRSQGRHDSDGRPSSATLISAMSMGQQTDMDT